MLNNSMDEITSGLDKTNKDREKTIILVSHSDNEKILSLADNVQLLSKKW